MLAATQSYSQEVDARLPCPQGFSDDDLLRDGYSRVPVESRALPFAGSRGALGTGQGILVNAAGCWHARVRNTARAPLAPDRLWIEEVDPRAIKRYRRRSWVRRTQAPPPSGFRVSVTCGDPRCINPDHLELIALPESTTQSRGPGRWHWFMEVDEETGEEVEAGEWVSDADEPRESIEWGQILVRKPRPKAVPQRAQWEATRDWQAIGTEVEALSQETIWSVRTGHLSFVDMSARWNLSVDAVRAIRYGRYGEGRRPQPKQSDTLDAATTTRKLIGGRAERPGPAHELPWEIAADTLPLSANVSQAVAAKSRLLSQQGLWALRKRPLPEPVTAERPTEQHSAKPRSRTRGERKRAAARHAAAAFPLKPQAAPETTSGPGRGHGRKARGEASGAALVTEADVRTIRASTDGLKALGQRYGMSPQAIHKIRTGKSWAHVT